MATALAVTIGSRWAASRIPVPNRMVVVADAAAANATSGSRHRLYSSSSSAAPVAGGVRRLTGMCVCSGSQSDCSPRASASRASSTTSMLTSVANIVIPYRMGVDSNCFCVRSPPPSGARRTQNLGGASDPVMICGMAGICDGRVVLVTGAGRGLGRAHALELARQGARVVVNDLGCELDGTGGGSGPAGDVVAEIRAGGAEAIANGDDVADFDGAARMVTAALETFGALDVVVNNAGFVRDRMFANAAEDEWDAVVRVHLKGHFAVARHAAAHWRDQAKAGQPVDARIINTSSGAGILGSVGQAAYASAKAGIATLTLVQAAELGRYGVTANALCPAARTRMTEAIFTEMMATPDEPAAFDAMAPENVSPLVAWLASPQSAHVTGRMFEVDGGKVGVATGWQHGPTIDKGDRWDAAELGPVVDGLLAEAPAPAPVYGTS